MALQVCFLSLQSRNWIFFLKRQPTAENDCYISVLHLAHSSNPGFWFLSLPGSWIEIYVFCSSILERMSIALKCLLWYRDSNLFVETVTIGLPLPSFCAGTNTVRNCNMLSWIRGLCGTKFWIIDCATGVTTGVTCGNESSTNIKVFSCEVNHLKIIEQEHGVKIGRHLRIKMATLGGST